GRGPAGGDRGERRLARAAGCRTPARARRRRDARRRGGHRRSAQCRRRRRLVNRDIAHALLEIAIFAIGIYLVLRLLGTTRGSGVVRGLAIVLIGVIVVFSILIQELDLRRLGLIFDKL